MGLSLIRPRFGAHMSVAGGLHRAVEIAQTAGCDCVQLFVKNQRQWAARPLGEADIQLWRDTVANTGIGPGIAHATYLLNPASPNAVLRTKSIDAFVLELQRCEALGIAGLVLHPGAHLGSGEAAGCRLVSSAMRECLARTEGARVQIWLEITAGQGTCLGHRIEHLRDIIGDAGGDERLGVCFDTCHALAAGYTFNTPDTYAATMGEFDRTIGLGRLRCFHLNDSLREVGSRVDRHTHIGKGHVGRQAFRMIVNDPRFLHTPMIIETPKGVDARGRDLDRVNLAALRRLLARPQV